MKSKQIKSIIKKTIRKTAKTLTNEVLGIFNTSPLTFSEIGRQIYGLPIHQKELSQKQLMQTVKRLKKRGWLLEKQNEDVIYYRLSKEGILKKRIFYVKTETRQKAKEATIIIFDIPEAKSNFRHFLRRFLLRNGFVLLQESVFITPYKLSANFYGVLKQMDLLKYITIIKGYVRHGQS